MYPELETLKKALHPEVKMNIVDQCRIVAFSLGPDGDFPRQTFKLAQYLVVSKNKVYKMWKIDEKTTPGMKDWLRTTKYEVDKAYKLSTLDALDQAKFVDLTPAQKTKFLKELDNLYMKVETKEEEEATTTEPLSPPVDIKI